MKTLLLLLLLLPGCCRTTITVRNPGWPEVSVAMEPGGARR